VPQAHERLQLVLAHGQDESPVLAELLDQRARDLRRARRDHDRVVGRTRQPAERAIGHLHRHPVAVAEPLEHLARTLGETRDALE